MSSAHWHLEYLLVLAETTAAVNEIQIGLERAALLVSGTHSRERKKYTIACIEDGRLP